MVLATTPVACKGRSHSAPEGDGQAPRAELAPGALMIYQGGSGMTGDLFHLTVFVDGRVERTPSGRPESQLRVPIARVEKLAADLASTGVLAEKDGTWAPSRPVPDGGGAGLIVRDNAGAVHAYDWAAGATAPAAVERALRVCAEFASEVQREHPRSPCACQPGDPLCACL